MRHIIETDRLVLRQLQDCDAARISEYGTDIDVARMTGSFPHPFPLLSAEFKIMDLRAQQRRGLAHPYVVTRKGDDELIGVSDLFKRNPDSLWEIGYWIGRPFWGHGYVTEACTALLREADIHLGPQDRIAGVFTDNLGSAQVLKKLGFEKSGPPDVYFSMARLAKAESQDYILRASS